MGAIDPFQIIRAQWCAWGPDSPSPVGEVWFCHRYGSESAMFEWFGGVRNLRDRLVEAEILQEAVSPVLLAGMHDESFVRRWASHLTVAAGPLFDWPGFHYLDYDSGEHQVRAAWVEAHRGANVPLPKALMDEAAPAMTIRNLSEQVRHWLRHVGGVLRSDLTDLERALAASRRPHATYLIAQSAITPEHEAMLVRMWRLGAARKLDHDITDAINDLKRTIGVFKVSCDQLEAKRTELRNYGDGSGETALRDLVAWLKMQLGPAVTAALIATEQIDAAVASAYGRSSADPRGPDTKRRNR